MPVAGHPYDLASLTGTSGAWLRWGVPLFYNWKFGADLTILAVGSQSLAFVLEHLGMSGAAAIAAAWKLPLVVADLLVGVILLDLGRHLRCLRPGLIATLWLLSPVPLWVSAGHGQIESLTVLAVVLSLDLLTRRRPLLAGVVVGLGIGVEYLPGFVALIVIFWLYASVIGRREVCRFVAGCAGALAFCFGPALATDLGRTSLLGGLAFTASVASHPGHTKAASASVGSSLWAIFDLSPGPFWLFIALSTAAALMIVVARKARSADSIGRKRLGVLAAGGLLLCVTLFDPGVLPQFSVLVLAGLCLVGMCVDLSPAAIILGPSLQLAAGFLYVYGGSFQSFWYDMWVMTGTGGWPFPQSVQVQGLGVPPRRGRHHARPDIRAVSNPRDRPLRSPAHRHGSFSNNRRSAWHGVPCHLVVAASLLARRRVGRTSNSGGFPAHYAISAWHANDDVRDGKDHLLVLGSPCRAGELYQTIAEADGRSASILFADDSEYRGTQP